MEVIAIGKNIGVSRIKARIPADVVRNMNALEAVAVLTYMQKGSALPVKKVIESAIANAKHNYNVDPDALYIKEIKIDKGPQKKMNTRRMIPAAKGRAKFFDRKYCHIKVILSDRPATAEPKASKIPKKTDVSLKAKKSEPKTKKSSVKGTKKSE